VTTASDVYSLGVLLYKLLTGRLPRDFQGLHQGQIERLLAETEPERPSTVAPSERPERTTPQRPHHRLTGDLDAIVLKALRTAAARRYSSVDQLDADLDRLERGLPVEARAGSWLYVAGKFVRRHRAAVAVVAALVVLLVGFAAAMGLQSARITRERDRARLERDKKQEVLELILEIFHFSDPYVLPGEELTVREALARSVPVLETGLRDQPAVRAELLHTSGTILNILGEYRTAKHQLEEALEIRRDLYGENHRDVIQTLAVLADARKALGELEEAEALALRAVERARQLEPEDGESLTIALNALVAVRCHGSQHAEAAAPAEDALALARRLSSLEQETLALEYLGLIRMAQGEYAVAEPLYRQALALRRERYGAQHPSLINPLNNLGVILRRSEQFAAAAEVYRELLALQRASFGEEYQDPVILANLAGALFAQEAWAEALEFYRQARDAKRQSSGPEHWMVLYFELAIENVRIQAGEPVAAQERLRRLIDEWEPRLREGHWLPAHARSILGDALSVQGRCEEAEDLLTASFERLLQVSRQRRAADALERLRRHFARCGRAEEIEPYEVMLAAKD
jgi:tetratricopeptide (TPR) repeat protein